MTKPWEETWTVSEYRDAQRFLCITIENDSDSGDVADMGTCNAGDTVHEDGQRERAQLAAQAPAMARLLLEIVKEARAAGFTAGSNEIDEVLRAAGVIP